MNQIVRKIEILPVFRYMRVVVSEKSIHWPLATDAFKHVVQDGLLKFKLSI